jgi:hypothetical protein
MPVLGDQAVSVFVVVPPICLWVIPKICICDLGWRNVSTTFGSFDWGTADARASPVRDALYSNLTGSTRLAQGQPTVENWFRLCAVDLCDCDCDGERPCRTVERQVIDEGPVAGDYPANRKVKGYP